MSNKERFKLTSAVYVILRRGDEILLHQRISSYQNGKYGLVAGHIDGGEVAENAMAREAYEEAGVTIDPADLKFVHVAHRLGSGASDEYIDLFFECTKWSGEVENMEPEKCKELVWRPMDNLPAEMIPYVRNVLERIARGETYSSYEKELE